MTKTDPATTIALISLLIAFAALMISWKAMQIQRAEHKLNLAAAQEKARLKSSRILPQRQTKTARHGLQDTQWSRHGYGNPCRDRRYLHNV